MTEPFETSIRNHIAEITLNRPPVNALAGKHWHQLAITINELSNNPQVRVVLIRAEGRGFCAGVDIKELQVRPDMIGSVNKGNYDTFKAIHQAKVPVIVAMHGFVLGGGIGICGAADIVVASECARFGVPEVDRGALGGGAHLQRLLPLQKVRYLYFTGLEMTAQEAARYGGIEAVVKRDQLHDHARAIAEKIAEKSPALISLAKEALNGVEASNLERNYRWEQGFTAQAYLHSDSQMTRDAFVTTGENANF